MGEDRKLKHECRKRNTDIDSSTISNPEFGCLATGRLEQEPSEFIKAATAMVRTPLTMAQEKLHGDYKRNL